MAGVFDEYAIVWLKSAYKAFQKLPITDQKAIVKHIDLLLSSYDSLDIKKLKGYSNLYRLRVGDYRVIFTTNKHDQKFCISAVGHRREIYNLISN